MAGWADTSATHGSFTLTRGADELVLGAGGAVKATTLRRLMGYGVFIYSNVPLSDEAGESPSRPTLGPLIGSAQALRVGADRIHIEHFGV